MKTPSSSSWRTESSWLTIASLGTWASAMFDARHGLKRCPTSLAAAKRIVCILAAAAYLTALGGFLLQSVLGDAAPFPLSYFFTWDMFPSHNTRSLRRVAIDKTAAGKYVQLHPSPFQQYRGGVHGDLTHVELDARGLAYRDSVEQIVRLSGASRLSDPVAHVYLFEKYWPSKYNYPADLYEAWAGTPKPDRVAWRLIDEFDVPAEGSQVDLPAGDGS
ncbi:MAG: hypothetical protein ACM3U2_11830 [Deltaproteobacteria bacterium]